MAQGTIIWFDPARGFGFIRPDMGPRDVFVHASALGETGLDTPPAGLRVEFELVQLRDGRLAAQRVLAAEESPCRTQAAAAKP
jgi:CspA family cold shock protein